MYFLVGKGGRCVRLTTLPPSCAVVMKSGNLNFLEPSGPLEACNETALPFIFFGSKCFANLLRQSQCTLQLVCELITPVAKCNAVVSEGHKMNLCVKCKLTFSFRMFSTCIESFLFLCFKYTRNVLLTNSGLFTNAVN